MNALSMQVELQIIYFGFATFASQKAICFSYCLHATYYYEKVTESVRYHCRTSYRSQF